MPSNPFRRGELRPYQPTLREEASNLFARFTGDDYEAHNRARNIFGQGRMGLADWTPAGAAFALDEAGRTMRRNPFLGAGQAALAVVPIPGARGAGKKATAKTLEVIQREAAERGVQLSVQDGRQLVVSKIVVPKESRSSGIGSQIMRDLTDLADASGKTMALTPDGSFGGSVPRLKQFYGRFGFVENKGRARDFDFMESMYRTPRGDAP